MKRYASIVVAITLSIFNLIGFLTQPTSADEGNIGCRSLRGCDGSALCNSPGQSFGCYIACDNGAQINCPKDSEAD